MSHLWEVPVLWVKHALMEDTGRHSGIYHADCSGKVWAYEERQECDICGKVWSATPDRTTDNQAQDEATEERTYEGISRAPVPAWY